MDICTLRKVHKCQGITADFIKTNLKCTGSDVGNVFGMFTDNFGHLTWCLLLTSSERFWVLLV